MPTRSVSQRWRSPIALIVLALLFACLKGRSPTDASASDVRFDLRAQVSGGSVLHVTVVYLDQPANSETLVPVILLDQRINVASGTQSLPLTIDLTRCLADPLHLSGSTCELEAGVVLEQGGQAVDSVGVGPITVTPGQTVNANASLVPVGSVVVFPDTASLTVGAITTLGDSVFSPTHAYLPNTAVTWASADTTIAKVNANGAVTGAGAGTTTVSATAGGQSGFATIIVTGVTTGGGGLSINPSAISFSAPAGGTLPVPGYLPVNSTDTSSVGNLASSIAYQGSTTGWLVANVSDSSFGSRVVKRKPGLHAQSIRRQTSGTGVSTPATLDVHPTTTNLPAGVYGATITVTGSGSASTTISVTYTITAVAPVLSFSPNPVSFSQYAYGSARAPEQTAFAANSGTGGTLGAIAESGTITYTGPDTGWLSVLGVGPDTVALQPRLNSLSLVTDTARMRFTATGAANPDTLVILVSTYVTYTKVVLGASFGCGLTTAATVYCWGGDGQGELGDSATDLGVTTPVRTHLPYSSTNPVIDIEAGSSHACALTQNGTVYCWGSNGNGQVGNGTSTGPVTTPAQITGTWGQITLGAQHTCAIQGTPPLAGANYVYCWGNNSSGQFGNNLPSGTPQTTPLNTGLIYYLIAAGGLHTCGINNKVVGGLYCWGNDQFGQLGNGYSGSFYSAPVQAHVLDPLTGGLAVVTSVSAGNSTTCAVDNAGNGDCWGDNTDGEVGNGNTTTPVVNPTLIPGSISWTSISVGTNSVCGIASTADYCWGYNNYGQLGNGATANASTPTPTAVIGSGALFTQFIVGQGSQSACYITGGVVSCFGLDSNGQLGLGTPGVSAVPNPTAMTAQPAPAGVGPSRVVPHRPVVKRRQ
jgi:alpha-tubulin suppressor-like RCC1 family protein